MGILENDNEFSKKLRVPDVFITPPESSALTGEDFSDDEEKGYFNNFSRPQLATTAELVFLNNTHIGKIINTDHTVANTN